MNIQDLANKQTAATRTTEKALSGASYYPAMKEIVYFSIKYTEYTEMTVMMNHHRQNFRDRVNRDVLKFSFANRVIEQWNKLPETVVNVNCVNTFKNKLDTFLKAKEGN